jgi:hypothetical protein
MTDLGDFDLASENEELRAALRRQQAATRKAKRQSDDLIEAVFEAARDAALALGRPPAVAKPIGDRRKRDAEVALIHATDWQLGKHTSDYDIDTCEKRIMRFAEKIASLTDIQRADHPVKEAHVMFGGDMVEGISIFPGQAYEVEAHLFEQLFATAGLMERFVRELLAVFDQVTVTCEYGNHGRLGRKGDMPGGDNIDRMAYRIAADKFDDEQRCSWHTSSAWHQHVRIGNYTALLVHGDEIKSFGGNTPAFGILRKCNQWAAGVIDPFDDVYMGHFHTPMTLTMANGGQIYVSGSPESENVYAKEFMAATGRPSQRLHFVDPDRGQVSASYIVWLGD